MPFLLLFCFVIIGNSFCAFMFVRNEIVYKNITKIIERCSSLALNAIKENRDWVIYYEILDSISYHQMLWNLFKFKWNCEDFKKAY